MFFKWLPWRYLLKGAARSHGFLDPLSLLARFTRFGQPTEVMAPIELLRSGMAFHARGMINNRAIQHNLDWIWPYWVVRQFDRKHEAFIPRGYSITHINLTARNWTAIGVPDCPDLAIVDPAGLVTPLYDGWSIDAWLLSKDFNLIPSRETEIHQQVTQDPEWTVETRTHNQAGNLRSVVQGRLEGDVPVCSAEITCDPLFDGWLAVAVRPCNPEGVSFINTISRDASGSHLIVNGEHPVAMKPLPRTVLMSRYEDGDVFGQIGAVVPEKGPESITCDIGLATAACLYPLKAGEQFTCGYATPLIKGASLATGEPGQAVSAAQKWEQAMNGLSPLRIGDAGIQRHYHNLIKTLILHSPGDTLYAGPYGYRNFWYRDAVYTLYAMLAAGLTDRAGSLLEQLIKRQGGDGYFHSQEGEWDSNGQMLWIMNTFLHMTGINVPEHWLPPIRKAADWIKRKLASNTETDQGRKGLMPAGYSAEHFGPNNYYYWDDFWSAAGLYAAAEMLGEDDPLNAEVFSKEGRELMEAIAHSLAWRSEGDCMSIAPNRRFDSAAVGTLCAGYPLRLWSANDVRLIATARRLIETYEEHGAFFHEIAHSGMNMYLSLHIAQVMLQAGDDRARDIFNAVTACASSTGQWPEAIHPRTGGGCMGDGQHIWAASEWLLMLRNSLMREDDGRLILGSGLQKDWFDKDKVISFGPAPTEFGICKVTFRLQRQGVAVAWEGDWYDQAPCVDILVPESDPVYGVEGDTKLLCTWTES